MSKQVSEPVSEAGHCRDLVKANDLDRYLASLLADKEQQRALFAIYAFDAEISNIAGQVSEPGIGEIRLQWWRDELDGVFGGPCENHPVLKELQPVVAQYDLPKHLFTKLIDAHQFDLYRQPMASLDDLTNYMTATSTAMTDLACRILIGYDALELEFLIARAGLARGFAKMLRTLPSIVAQKQCFLPMDLLDKHQLTANNILAAEYGTSVRLVVREIIHLVVDNLQTLRQEQGGLKKAVLPAFYPAGLADLNLQGLISGNRNPLKRSAPVSQLKMQWELMKKSILEKI